MSRKLDNEAWEEYINKFEHYKGSITVKDFCIENKISKTQFYYHKKRLAKIKIEDENKEPVFHAISLNNKNDNIKENSSTSSEIKINIGNAHITIPVTEITLITSIIKELVSKC